MDECYQLEALFVRQKIIILFFLFSRREMVARIGPNSLSERADSSKVASQEWGQGLCGLLAAFVGFDGISLIKPWLGPPLTRSTQTIELT